ncbi:MAG: ankyrin repeat domain-containing protein [Gemmatimonadota bacterium]|nr:ankyrin repeat domain-containing protein [Gemmatimonadota bacterium]
MDIDVQPYIPRTVLVPTRENPTSINHLKYSWYSEGQEDNDTALMRAAGAGHIEVVGFLISNGADRTIKNHQKQLALTFAAAYGHLEVVKLIVEWYDYKVQECINDPKVKVKSSKYTSDSTRKMYKCMDLYEDVRWDTGLLENSLGMSWDAMLHGPHTNIQWAAYHGHLDVVEYLYPLLQGKQYQWPHLAFELAVLGGHMDVVNYFINHDHAGSRISKSRGLMQAAYMNHVEIVSHLLEVGANVNWRMADWIGLDTPEGRLYFKSIGFGPPHAAIQAGSKESLRLLLMHWMRTMGADGRDKYGMTALHFAAAGGDLDMSNILIDNGCPIDPLSDIGMTPLMFAAQWGHIDVVNMLLGKGVDPSLVSAYGETALSLAEEIGHADIVEMLQ